MTTRHDQLFAALVIARQNHRKDPSESNFRALAAARVPMLEFNTIKNKLEDELFDAKRSGDAGMHAELFARLVEHNMPHDDRATVKLVDAAGTLRLDLNDRRLHMTRDQALELFVSLGAALDDGDGRSVGCAEGCEVGLFVVDDSPAGFVHVDAHRGGGESVFMSLTRADAIKAAASMVAIAKDIPE